MADLNDFLNIERPEDPDFGEEIFMDSRCENCNLPTDKSFFNSKVKKITFICPSGHIFSIDSKKFSWLQ